MNAAENIRAGWPIIATILVAIAAGISAWFDMRTDLLLVRNDLLLLDVRVVSLEDNHEGDEEFKKLAQWNHTLRNTDQSNNELKHVEVDDQVENLRQRLESLAVENARKESVDQQYNNEIDRIRDMHSPPSDHVSN